MSEVRAQQPEVPVPAEEPSPPPAPAKPDPVPETPTPEPLETPQPAAAQARPEIPSTLRPSLISQAEAPAAPPAFEPYNLPEGVVADERQVSELNRIVGARDLTPQQQGQALVDLYAGEVQRLQQTQHEIFNRTREEWRNQFFNDPELGGNRQDTTLRQAAQMRDRFAGNDAQRSEFIAALNHTGIGDHPAFIRFLANVYAELAAEAAPRIVAAQSAAPVTTDGPARRYPTMVRG